eukprot:bmy_20853T0
MKSCPGVVFRVDAAAMALGRVSNEPLQMFRWQKDSMKDDRGGHRHSQVGLHSPARPGAGHQEERAPVAAGRLQDLVAGAQRGQQDGLRAVQLRGEEEQPEEGLPREEPQGHARFSPTKVPCFGDAQHC